MNNEFTMNSVELLFVNNIKMMIVIVHLQYSVIANIQPSFVPMDTEIIQRFLPSSVLPFTYIWKTLMRQKNIICAGTSS